MRSRYSLMGTAAYVAASTLTNAAFSLRMKGLTSSCGNKRCGPEPRDSGLRWAHLSLQFQTLNATIFTTPVDP
ncbi:MAG: hypothetical protein ACETWE_08250, partial [Candidatus Bathyarchaeia archaeon]